MHTLIHVGLSISSTNALSVKVQSICESPVSGLIKELFHLQASKSFRAKLVVFKFCGCSCTLTLTLGPRGVKQRRILKYKVTQRMDP